MRLKVNGRRTRHAAFRSLLSIGLMRQPITDKTHSKLAFYNIETS